MGQPEDSRSSRAPSVRPVRSRRRNSTTVVAQTSKRQGRSRSRSRMDVTSSAGARAGTIVRRTVAAATSSEKSGIGMAITDAESQRSSVVHGHASVPSWIGLALTFLLTLQAVAFLSSDDSHVAAAAMLPPSPTSWREALTSRDSLRVLAWGWITAASTGLGALPFVRSGGALSPRYMALCNCIAAGMMISASVMLFWEGVTHEAHAPEQAAAAAAAVASDPHGRGGLAAVGWAVEAFLTSLSPLVRCVTGFGLGLAFILLSKAVLDKYEHLKLSGFQGADARRVVLILGVMTLHSLTEGIGLGVSFGSAHDRFGMFISATLAVHNVPEGLAVALVLTGRGVSVVDAALWAIFTSLPQPLAALPAFLEVRHFIPVLPVGLGLAAGAMSYVAVFELLAEAREHLTRRETLLVALPAALLMGMSQFLFK